jgi:1,4-dihydroxy-2-naphthoate octaprenyltransferase
MVAAILHANNVRDIDADRAVNKRTLAVRLGRLGARIEYVILVGGAYVAVVVLVLLRVMPVTTLLVLVTLPEAYRLNGIIQTSQDVPLLHQAMGRTALLHGQFGLWLVVGWGLALVARAIGITFL